MSLSDCPDCWETPCRCGTGYAKYTEDQALELINAILKGQNRKRLLKRLNPTVKMFFSEEENINYYHSDGFANVQVGQKPSVSINSYKDGLIVKDILKDCGIRVRVVRVNKFK